MCLIFRLYLLASQQSSTYPYLDQQSLNLSCRPVWLDARLVALQWRVGAPLGASPSVPWLVRLVPCLPTLIIAILVLVRGDFVPSSPPQFYNYSSHTGAFASQSPHPSPWSLFDLPQAQSPASPRSQVINHHPPSPCRSPTCLLLCSFYIALLVLLLLFLLAALSCSLLPAPSSVLRLTD